MPDSRFGDRFSRLEIPEEQRIDWGFLADPVALPRPLPVEEHAICAFVDGQVLVPGAGEARLRLYDLDEPLVSLGPTAAIETAWHERHAPAVRAAAAGFLGRVPVAVISSPEKVAGALAILRERRGVGADGALARVVAGARLLRLHGKLYDLKTLPEYVAVFSRAIDPALTAELGRLPVTAGPEAYLSVIAANLDKIHAKARSPLRNKMDTSRVIVGGITLLPLYVGPASALFDRYAEQLGLDLAIAGLARG